MLSRRSTDGNVVIVIVILITDRQSAGGSAKVARMA